MTDAVPVNDGELHDEEPTGEEQVANSPRERKLELAVTLLLALSALLSAWCAYESSRFGGESSALNTRASSLQVESARAENRAGQQTLLDVDLLGRWFDAQSAGDTTKADFFRSRFRAEMVPAFDAWIELDPLHNASAPKSPFEMPEYRSAASDAANESLNQAKVAEAESNDKGATGDNYVLTVVLFAAALFLLGIQSRIGNFELRAALVAVAGFIVLGTTLWVIVLPKLWPG
jgi:hypothetical protein